MAVQQTGEIFDQTFVRALFDEMARTYGIVNLMASFGFAALWRKQCLGLLPIPPGLKVVDLMTGMGELCPDLARRLGENGSITALDLSPIMCQQAKKRAGGLRCPVTIVEGDVLECPLQPQSADLVVSTFGIKTFSPEQMAVLARQLFRLLKPGGRLALLEISVPPNRWLRWPYLFYISYVIPWIGRLFLGNPENYRMLGVYTEAFGNCDGIFRAGERAGLVLQKRSFFFGCATAVFGFRPKE